MPTKAKPEVKRGRGRPRTRSGPGIQVPLSDAERETVKRTAAKAEQSVAAWARAVILRALGT
jgi:hypothetical protein